MGSPRPLLIAFALLSGCATTAPVRVAWPAAPATERIRFVRSLAGQKDLDGSLTRFFRRLAGADAPEQLYHPVGVAVTSDGGLLAVTDQALAQLFLFDLQQGEVRTVPKEVLGGAPVGVAFEAETAFVIVPALKLALGFDRKGKPVRTLQLEDCDRPTGLAIDVPGKKLYVADTSSASGSGHSVHVHQLQTGAHLATLGRKGEGEGELFFPTFVSLAPDGLYVADTMNARVSVLGPDGRFVRQVGERGDQFGQFDKPKGVATDSFGNLYVVDSFFSVVQIFNPAGKLLLFFGGRGDSAGFLSNPAGIAIDAHNRIYVANGLNFRVDVYELVNTVAADSAISPPAPATAPAREVAPPS